MADVKRIILVGAGGIGSYFVKFLFEDLLDKNQLPSLNEIVVYDPDKIEFKNELYTIYDCSENEGKFKVDVLKDYIKEQLVFLNQRITITTKKEIANVPEITKYNSDHTVIVCAVDGSSFRSALWGISDKLYNNNLNCEWIDLRSVGDDIVWARNPKNDTEKIAQEALFMDMKLENRSCQLQSDLAGKNTKLGNRIVAYTGLALLLNINRGIDNDLYRINDITKK